MNRRESLRLGAAALAAWNVPAWAGFAAGAGAPRWPVGVFNRAWSAWSVDDALKGARDAGFKTIGLIAAQNGEHLIGANVDDAAIDTLKGKVADAGLDPVLTAVRIQESDPLPKLTDDLRRQIDQSARLGARYVMTFGVDKPEHFATFEKALADASAHAQAAGVKMVIKPHGGITLGPTEILGVLQRVNHPNLSVWYDAGNILYYTGADPVAAYTPLAKHVTGLCAKDCTGPKGGVMISFGEGKVDHPALLAKLAAAGFNGPVMIEGIKVGKTAEETTANARLNRLSLERAIAAVPA